MPAAKKSRAAAKAKPRRATGAGAGKPTALGARTFDARPDTLDFRDRMFEPTLVEVPIELPLSRFVEAKVPILDQGKEGACTGFGLATVVHYLLRKRKVKPERGRVSPWMLYAMAQRYDEWEGEDYEGSSARGAMKGWHKHGACGLALWPQRDAVKAAAKGLTAPRADDARDRPLGAYLRVNHKELVAMHSALAEVGALYATSLVHSGWGSPGKDGTIDQKPGNIGAHAFAIVGYDRDGFWIQNSWGTTWGRGGYGHLAYDDWLENGTDVWVARLGVPIHLVNGQATSVQVAAAARVEATSFELRRHVVSLGNDGRLRTGGTYGTDAAAVAELVRTVIPAQTQAWNKKKKRILLYAHGGLTAESSAIQRVADYRGALLDAEIYPISFIWHSDYWSTLKDILADAVRERRPEGFWGAAKDFLLERLDDALEPIARVGTGKAEWTEMKENAERATTAADGGARLFADELAALVKKDPSWEIHMIGHSAGAVFHARLAQYLASKAALDWNGGKPGLGLPIETMTLWAPAATVDLFAECYLPLLGNGIGSCALFTLTDQAEQDDDCAKIYNKSLLYLVSHAFEAEPRIPLLKPDGTPIIGMERFLAAKWPGRKVAPTAADKAVWAALAGGRIEWVRAPNIDPEGSPTASRSRAHGAFDDDGATVKAALARMLGTKVVPPVELSFTRSQLSRQERRAAMEAL